MNDGARLTYHQVFSWYNWNTKAFWQKNIHMVGHIAESVERKHTSPACFFFTLIHLCHHHTHSTSDTICVCVLILPHTILSGVSECPVFQCGSGTNQSECRTHSLRAQFHRTAPAWEPIASNRSPGYPQLPSALAQFRDSHEPPS